MKVSLANTNPALISIFKDPDQTITLDANFLIPPDRYPITSWKFDFSTFRNVWLDPIFNAFPKLAIHESVNSELVGSSIRNFVDSKNKKDPPEIIIHRDSDLNVTEKILRDTIETKIYPHTRYQPLLNNKDDRGEVKSLSYIAAKGIIFFAANDNNAIQLIEKSEEWSTGLDSIQAVKMYELIFYLYRKELADKDALRGLYKYQYRITSRERL